jgi:hypothetical protein
MGIDPDRLRIISGTSMDPCAFPDEPLEVVYMGRRDVASLPLAGGRAFRVPGGWQRRLQEPL